MGNSLPTNGAEHGFCSPAVHVSLENVCSGLCPLTPWSVSLAVVELQFFFYIPNTSPLSDTQIPNSLPFTRLSFHFLECLLRYKHF